MRRRSPESDLSHMYLSMMKSVSKWIYVSLLDFCFLISDISEDWKVESQDEKTMHFSEFVKVLISCERYM